MASASRPDGTARDAIVVGGGHNGLACAAYLARAGSTSWCSSGATSLGGAAVTEEPWPGYRISTASYVVSLMPPQIVRSSAQPFRLPGLDPRARLLRPVPGRHVADAVGRHGTASAEEIAKLSKHDADAYLEFDRYFERLGRPASTTCCSSSRRTSARRPPRWLGSAAAAPLDGPGRRRAASACSRSPPPTCSTSGSRTSASRARSAPRPSSAPGVAR